MTWVPSQLVTVSTSDDDADAARSAPDTELGLEFYY
jgi:hypothetical protein